MIYLNDLEHLDGGENYVSAKTMNYITHTPTHNLNK